MLLHFSGFFLSLCFCLSFLLHWDFTVFCLWIFGVSQPVVLDVSCIQIKFVLLTSLIFRHSLSLKILCLYILNTFGIGLYVAFFIQLWFLYLFLFSFSCNHRMCVLGTKGTTKEFIWELKRQFLFFIYGNRHWRNRFKNGRWIDVGKGWNFSFLNKFLFYWKSVDKSILWKGTNLNFYLARAKGGGTGKFP